MRRILCALFVVASTVGVASSCRSATQLRVLVTTDAPCDRLETRIAVGTLGDELERRTAASSKSGCESADRVGTLVVVPSGDDSGEIAVRVSMALGDATPEQCQASPGDRRCIVARRSLRFVPHSGLTMQIAMRLACAGVVCGATETCVAGVCRDARIPDPSACEESCGEEVLGPGATRDAGSSDPGSDSGLDGSTPDASTTTGCIGELVSGTYHSCVRKIDGTLWCWGSNLQGQLGNTSTLAAQPPHLARTEMRGIAGGLSHSCGLTNEGRVTCWGFGTGSGETGGTPFALAVAAGFNHSCAVAQDKSAICWGAGSKGALGNGSQENALSPTPVRQLTSVASIAVGGTHGCAVREGGELWCWGENGNGQLGLGSFGGDAATCGSSCFWAPKLVPTLKTGVTKVALGQDHTCARKASGELFCWGINDLGQVGAEPSETCSGPCRTTPVQVLTQVKEFATGAFHSCAIVEDGTVWCWGDNRFKQMGVDRPARFAAPTQVISAGHDNERVAASGLSTCVVKRGGDIYCWGYNGFQDLGSPGGTPCDADVSPNFCRASPQKVPLSCP